MKPRDPARAVTVMDRIRQLLVVGDAERFAEEYSHLCECTCCSMAAMCTLCGYRQAQCKCVENGQR